MQVSRRLHAWYGYRFIRVWLDYYRRCPQDQQQGQARTTPKIEKDDDREPEDDRKKRIKYMKDLPARWAASIHAAVPSSDEDDE